MNCSIKVPTWNSRGGAETRAARKPWSTKTVPNNQNGTVLAPRPQQQAKITAASTRLPPPCGKNAERGPCDFLEPSTQEFCDSPRRYTVADRPAASTPRAGMIGVKNKAT